MERQKISITGIFKKEKEGGYSARIKEIPYAIAQGESEEEAEENLFKVLWMVLEDMAELYEENDSNDQITTKQYPILQPA